MKISDDDRVAEEEGFWVLSVKGCHPLTNPYLNTFAFKILELNALRIGVVTDSFEIDELIGEDKFSWGLMDTGEIIYN